MYTVFDCALLLPMFCSTFMYELTKEDSTAPGSDVVKTWAEKIGAHVGVYLRYSQRLHQILVRQANYLRGHVRKCTGSIPKQRLLQQKWALQLLRADVQLQAMQDKMDKLHAELAHAKEQYQSTAASSSTGGRKC